MNKYEVLVSILDKICEESRGHPMVNRYIPPSGDPEHINQARARAFIHLYLMVSFGLLDFASRERVITDNGYDGGIDAYFINKETKKIYLIQSKFRTTDRNFAEKNISLDEIVSMDVNRILAGNDQDEKGNSYNGKIKQLIREVGEIENVARYEEKIIVLANLGKYTPGQMKKLFDGTSVEVFDHERCFNELVFPVVSGTFFNASELNIYLDLSNKNAGSKISYEVKTQHGDCQITVLFVPTIEIAKTLSKYKNSILRHNPRSYLELEGKKVNNSIRETIQRSDTNEFALFNNGITMISDDTDISEKIGIRSKAQLAVKNPQIINGGQTAYTLSKIYDELPEEEAKALFAGKEVLLKVITLMESDASLNTAKLKLIDSISTATNQQTAVFDSDRVSNEPVYEALQAKLFSRYGIFFEKKRGEFGDGISRGYIGAIQVLERNMFFRLYLAIEGKLNKCVGKKLFLKYDNPEEVVENDDKLDDFYFAYLAYSIMDATYPPSKKKEKDFYAWLYILTQKYKPKEIIHYQEAIHKGIAELNVQWIDFIKDFMRNDDRFIKNYVDKVTGESRQSFNTNSWYRNHSFEDDVKIYFGIGTISTPKQQGDDDGGDSVEVDELPSEIPPLESAMGK